MSAVVPTPDPGAQLLRISDLARGSGVAEATLRQWEARFGFPEPSRTPTGHRRYHPRDVEAVKRVLAARDAGLSMPAAIQQATGHRQSAPSVFAALREYRPELQVQEVRKRELVALTHAIEDESTRGAVPALVLGCFQRAEHYAAALPRWRELAAGAELAVAFADFDALRQPEGAPVELPIGRRTDLVREWVVVCLGEDRSACLVGWERPAAGRVADGDRLFEVLWTVERQAVSHVARAFADIAAQAAPDVGERIVALLTRRAADGTTDPLAHATALTNRMVGYVAATAARGRG